MMNFEEFRKKVKEDLKCSFRQESHHLAIIFRSREIDYISQTMIAITTDWTLCYNHIVDMVNGIRRMG